MQTTDTLSAIVHQRARLVPDAIALLAPSRRPMSYGRLEAQLQLAAAGLSQFGIRPADPVAVMLPSGPELATTCLAVSSIAICAPLNPTSTPEEVRSILERLGAHSLILPDGQFQAVRQAIEPLGVNVIDLAVDEDQPAGCFHFTNPPDQAGAQKARFAGIDDVALILQTAGTTGQPKLAPLTHRNWFRGAANNIAAFNLTEKDRCISVVPMFHNHGLVGTLAASLVAGGCVACTPAFDADRIFDWMDELAPTWYTAAATVHLAVLEQARLHPGRTASLKLRFIRTAAMPLSPHAQQALEEALGAPVLQSYGMTEAAQIISSNPLPPGINKAESVGKPVGVNQVCILDDDGHVLPNPGMGEIAVRGENVIGGYLGGPETNAASFVDGWLRTGDLGTIDEDGYLYIRGRVKEMINRGGMKVFPQEVEAALMSSPEVKQAVAFAVPHATLGEDVAAAVVLAKESHATVQQLRAAAAETLATYKVPGPILVVDGIPETAKALQGKIRRERLYELFKSELEAAASPQTLPPTNGTEIGLARIWAEILNLQTIGVDQEFFTLGGDSIHAARILARINAQFGTQLTIHDLLNAPTIRGLAELVGAHSGPEPFRADSARERSPSQVLIPLQPKGGQRPIFFVPTIGASSLYMRELALCFAPERPVYGFQPAFDGEHQLARSVEDTAKLYCQALTRFQATGPYALIGQSGGGCVAIEMAHRLAEQGREVDFLGLLDSYPPGHRQQATWRDRLKIHIQNLSVRKPREALGYVVYGLKRQSAILFSRLGKKKTFADRVIAGVPRQIGRDTAILIYEPRPYDGDVVLFKVAERPWYMRWDPMGKWTEILTGDLTVIDIPGDHNTLLVQPQAGEVAQAIRQELEKKRAVDLPSQD